MRKYTATHFGEKPLPFVTFTVHDHINAPVEQSPLFLEATDPVWTEIVTSTTFVLINECRTKLFEKKIKF